MKKNKATTTLLCILIVIGVLVAFALFVFLSVLAVMALSYILNLLGIECSML